MSWIPENLKNTLYLHPGETHIHVCTHTQFQVYRKHPYPNPPTPEVNTWTPGFKTKTKNPLSPRTKASSQLYFSIFGIKMFLKIFGRYPGIKLNWYVFKKISEQAIVIQWKSGKQTMDNVSPRVNETQFSHHFGEPELTSNPYLTNIEWS